MENEQSTELAQTASRATVMFEHSMERVGDALWRRLKRRPYVGVAVTSAAALTLASVVGVGEIVVACLAGYGMFKILRRNEPPSQAFQDVARIQKEFGL